MVQLYRYHCYKIKSPMVKLGNFFFRTRNYLFPLFYIFLFLPLPRISSNYPTLFYAGLAIVLLGQLVRGLTIGLVYIIRGGKNRRIYAEGLVTDGLFGHCRNPMYVGNILLIVGMSLLSNSLFAVSIMPVLFIFIYQAIVRAEEAFLEDKFGAGYRAYCGQVNRWWPNFQGLAATFKKHSFDFKNVIIKEYNTTYLWCLGTTLLLAYNTVWFLKTPLTFGDLLPFLLVILLLTVLYLGIRYYKKREQRQEAREMAAASATNGNGTA